MGVPLGILIITCMKRFVFSSLIGLVRVGPSPRLREFCCPTRIRVCAIHEDVPVNRVNSIVTWAPGRDHLKSSCSVVLIDSELSYLHHLFSWFVAKPDNTNLIRTDETSVTKRNIPYYNIRNQLDQGKKK